MLHREYFRKYESCQISWKSCLYSTHDTKAMAVFSAKAQADVKDIMVHWQEAKKNEYFFEEQKKTQGNDLGKI